MADPQDSLSDIRSAYAFDEAVLELGTAMLDGQAHPDVPIRLPLSMLNRHGLVAGATGTGKTKTLQLMAEQLSSNGVPVFLADIKGDVSGMAAPGEPGERIDKRAQQTGADWAPTAFPAEFLALGGLGTGVPVRATVTSFGPILLSKVMGLNETQESSLGLVFHYADQAGLPLLDLKDLRAVIQHLTSEEGKADLEGIGGVAKATANVILRELVTLEAAGGDVFFGEPEFDSADLLRTADDGRGVLSIMGLRELQDRPALFSTFLMWLIADLFQDLPEVGDADKPKLVFFFDEAHLLFADASKAFLDAITRTVRLIRSKGVGVVFVTQTPKDVPADVLAQLGNRVQHALRAFTPEDAKALKATVSTFPMSDTYDLKEALPALGIGEAVVTVLSDRGAPTPVAWTLLRPPASLMAELPAADQQAIVAASPLLADYGTALDRESAYEKLLAKVDQAPEVSAEQDDTELPERPRQRTRKPEKSTVEKIVESSAFKQAARTAAREITRSLFGVGRRRRRR